MAALPSPELASSFASSFATERLLAYWERFAKVFVGEDLVIQLACLGGAVALAYLITVVTRPICKRITEAIEERDDWIEELVDWVSDNLFRLLLASFLWSASLYFDAQNTLPPQLPATEAAAVAAAERGSDASPRTAPAPDQPTSLELAPTPGQPAPAAKNYLLLRAFASIATLWLVSKALPARIKSQPYYKMLFFVLAVGLMLNLLGIWPAMREGLGQIQLLPISKNTETQVTALTLLKGIIAILLLIPLTAWLLRSTEKKVARMNNVSPALRVLTVKLVKALVVVAAVLFALSSIGVNLSTFAVLGGAVGLGLGFGFQKVVSNLISGVILLSDKSIKPGDVIQVDDTYGWINTLGARYTSIITRDGTEHLIPNEMMITEKVVNWSFSDDNVRIKIPFGVSYSSDIHKVMDIALEAAKAQKRVLLDPPPVVRMMGFGDNSVDFELRVWIRDPAAGVNNLRSDLYVALWDAFREHCIEIPFPQRDLHIRDTVPVEIRLRKES